MNARCSNPNSDKWKWYGGRGISVCDRWRHSFETFLNDVGERPVGTTIDRIDNDGNYEPGNCRWATHTEQTRKQRKNILNEESVARLRDDRAAGMSFGDLGKKYGINKTTAHRAVTGITWKATD